MRFRYFAALLLAVQLAPALHAQGRPSEKPNAAEDAPPASTQPAPTSQPTSMPSLIPELPDYSGSVWERSFLSRSAFQ